jgi:hypothetical protein
VSRSPKSAADRRKNDVAARSRTASPAQSTGTPTPFHASTLYAVGTFLIVAALVAFAVLAVLTFQGTDLRDFSGGESWGENLIVLPILILMVAAAPMYLAEYHRRGSWMSRDRGFFEGGSNVVVTRPLRLWARALWISVSVLAWIGLIVLPVQIDIGSETFADSNESFWVLLVTHGVFAAGMAAVLAFSLLKRLTYDRLAARFADQVVHGSFSQLFWRFVSYRFRFELWFAFGCGAILGTIPLVYQSAAESCYTEACVLVPDPAWLTWIAWIAIGSGALALIGSLNAWRSGKLLESGESVS